MNIGVAYLARGADSNWRASCRQFVASYKVNNAGIDHSLYAILKGFASAREAAEASEILSSIDSKLLYMDDDSFDIGAYIEFANQVSHDTICLLNTTSEILADYWLYKLISNLSVPGVGIVSATGSLESMISSEVPFPSFPNPHVRTNAFAIERRRFRLITQQLKISNKLSAHFFESGENNLTKMVLNEGLQPIIVGRNGRGYSINNWVRSGTFRQGKQENLLVADNQTRSFDKASFSEKRHLAAIAWGPYLRNENFSNRVLIR